jgi:Tol biopolymer transport system component
VSRDGREIVFDSDRPGGQGASDIWTATRGSTSASWNAPVSIPQVNSPAGESRASISWDGTMLVFGSSREGGEGGSDIYVSTRERAASRRGPKTIEF